MYVADMHCDTVLELWYAKIRGQNVPFADTRGSDHELMVDLRKLREGNYLIQNFAMFADLNFPRDTSKICDPDWSWANDVPEKDRMEPMEEVEGMLAVFKEEMAAHAGVIRQVRTFADIEQCRKDGVIAALLTVEEGGVLGTDLGRLDRLYDEGVRMMTITWNYDNTLGHPNKPMAGYKEDYRKYFRFVPRTDDGLTPFGKEAVEKMASLGILPDVSHLSDAGFYDLADIVKGPFVASHSNARAVCGCNRNMTDEMIRIVADHGGVIGLNFCAAFLSEADREEDCVSDAEIMARHARHIMNAGGREVLGIGTDFDGISPDGLSYSSAEQMPSLYEAFLRNGFTEEETDGIFYKNVLRVFPQALR